MSNTTTLKLALIGCGGIAQAHWAGIKKLVPRIHVTAVVDSNPSAAATMAAQTGARAFASIEDAMAHADVDAVDIMLPHDLHEAAALCAFAANKHVLLEKPMAHTLASADRILAAARRSSKVFMVAEQSQYWPDVLLVQQLIRNGAIGDPVSARAFFGGTMPAGFPSEKPWRFYTSRSGGGVTMDGGAHWLRPLRMWLGDVKEVMATTGRLVPEMEGESMAHALLRFDSGVIAVFDALVSPALLGGGDEFRITGTRGELLIERDSTGRVLLFNAAHPQGNVMATKGHARQDAFGHELNDFADAVLNGTPPVASAEHSLGELRIALAIYRSAETKQWETVANP